MVIKKDGAPWQTVSDCATSMLFEERGSYEATCQIDTGETCSTTVQVDIMTIIQTGPFLPLVIILALGVGGYITYRRRTTV
jgi:hypothetical protein